MRFLNTVLFSVCLIGVGPSVASDFPRGPVHLVVPLAPGGTTDIVARLLAEKMSVKLGEAVVVENRPGAGGTIASNYVAKAKPDGYTILMGTIGTMAVAPAMYEDLSYDPDTAFEPISSVSTGQFVIVASSASGITSFEELLSRAKDSPDKINYGSAGNGSTLHLGMELLKQSADINLTHVPYKGSGPLVTALAAGEVDVGMPDIPSALGFIKSGRLVPLAVTGFERSSFDANVPTVEERGLEGFNVSVWLGIVAPKGTPETTVEILNDAVSYALRDGELQEKLASLDTLPKPSSAAEFTAFVKNERQKWQKIVNAAGVKIN